MVPFSYGTSLYAAATALELATFFVLLVVCVLQFCFVRRHGDAARTWVKWARYSLALYTFTIFVLCGDSLIATVYDRFVDRRIEFFASEERGLTQARGFLDSIWWLCEAVVRVLLLVTLAALGAGLAMARSVGGAAAPAGWTRMPSLAGAAGGLTLLLAVSLFGVRCYFWAHYYDWQQERQGLVQGRAPLGKVALGKLNRVTIDMDFALNCIWLALSLLVLGLAVRTRALSRSAPHTKTASNYFLTCAALFVAQPLYNIIILIIFYVNTSYVPGVMVTMVTDVVFRVWSYVLILLILFVLGRKKIGGVWSTQQPFQTKDAAAGETVYQTPWGYTVTHQTAPQQVPVHGSQAQLNNYYAQPQQGAQDVQHQYQQNQYQQQQQQQPHYG
ncbi:hypothetical protein LMH87_011283 [Akanthomyces muscarius]|uniref:Uncharacterized protein n=1 Tax=Akanthomyces muscarius TaxID=2231603 RepID=A0A9W8Q8W7_AKAMU|nr:hypothetical protein LMH87_011283 [Akanthomyces muscarius]KAJ4150537.1 hypothetical protein LMH87_011283 [Akanthomyces muscarius]